MTKPERAMFAFLFLGLGGAACGGRSQEPATSHVTLTAAGSDITVFSGLRLLDGNGGAPIENAILVVEGQLVRMAGPAAGFQAPPNATVIDLTGKTVFPGLISDHSHLGMVDGLRVGKGADTRGNMLRQLAQFEAYGVTTVTSLGFNGALFYELQPQLHRGQLIGADFFGADRGIGVPIAAPPVELGTDRLYRPATVEQARAAVRETATRHPALVKIWVDDFHGKVEPKMLPEIQNAIIEEAHRNDLRVAAHVFYLEDAKRLVAAGVDVLAHGVRDRPVDGELIAGMKGHQTWYVPTLGLDETFYVFAERPPWTATPFFRHALQPTLAAQLDDPAWRAKILANRTALAENREAFAMNLRNLRTLHEAGVSIGFGTDSGATPLRIPGFAEHHELRLMTEAGFTPLEAITTATRDAAALLGLVDRGVLAPGKLADFVIVDGNPVTNIGDADRIVAVWHRGKERRRGVETFVP